MKYFHKHINTPMNQHESDSSFQESKTDVFALIQQAFTLNQQAYETTNPKERETLKKLCDNTMDEIYKFHAKMCVEIKNLSNLCMEKKYEIKNIERKIHLKEELNEMNTLFEKAKEELNELNTLYEEKNAMMNELGAFFAEKKNEMIKLRIENNDI